MKTKKYSPYGRKIEVSPIWSKKEKLNPISGHFWTELDKIIGYCVRGGHLMTSEHKTRKSAAKEAWSRRSFRNAYENYCDENNSYFEPIKTK